MSDSSVVKAAQEFMVSQDLPGWLIHDFRHSNPIFPQVVTASGHVTRPCFLYLPKEGSGQLLAHFVDAGKFTGSGFELLVYRSRAAMVEALTGMLSGAPSVAMEYSPQNALPRVSRVDAGTVELVRSLGVEVVSSADVMQYATQRWSPEQLQGHRRCAAKLGEIVNQAFDYIGERLASGVNEFDVAEFIRGRFAEEDLEAADGPIVSTNDHCSDPHYEPTREGSSAIVPGDWVLIDLWAKENRPANASRAAELEQGNDSVYADITWVAYVGDSPPQRHQQVFDIVTGARDAALKFLEDSHRKGIQVAGWQADEVARTYITERGYGDYFTHRLGHSISYEVHGEAVNLDNFETHDTRRIIPGVGFSIEPGIYLPEFGVRSEIDAFMSADGPFASSPVQRKIVLIGV